MSSQRKPRYLNLYFQVHQPKRLGQFSFFDIGTDRDYFDNGLNQLIMQRVAKECYIPANLLLLKLIEKYPAIRVTFSVSGTALKQMELFSPAALESFRLLAATGAVEFLSETYYHSLSCLISPEEFTSQVEQHARLIGTLFGVKPSVFRNTELIYSDEIGRMAERLGFKGVFTDGIDRIVEGQSPNCLYHHPDGTLKVFLRNYHLSDDIAFRFSPITEGEGLLTPAKYMRWLKSINHRDTLVTLGMDYETFGEHHKRATGIFQFLEGLLTSLANQNQIRMVTPSEAIDLIPPEGPIPVPNCISWADEERDLSAWLGNDMQRDAFETLSRMEGDVRQIRQPELLDTWRNLQTSDHFYYMSTKHGDDRYVHNYFNPYASPYEAFMNYMNILTDFSLRINVQKESIWEKRIRTDISEQPRKTPERSITTRLLEEMVE